MADRRENRFDRRASIFLREKLVAPMSERRKDSETRRRFHDTVQEILKEFPVGYVSWETVEGIRVGLRYRTQTTAATKE